MSAVVPVSAAPPASGLHTRAEARDTRAFSRSLVSQPSGSCWRIRLNRQEWGEPLRRSPPLPGSRPGDRLQELIPIPKYPPEYDSE